MQDYLTAPMPYLIGLPSPLALPGFPLVDLEEVVCVDLDMGTCSSGELNGVPLDHSLLPWSHHLKDALQVRRSEFSFCFYNEDQIQLAHAKQHLGYGGAVSNEHGASSWPKVKVL